MCVFFFLLCFSWATSFRDVIQRSVFWKHWPSRNFLWLMLPPRLPLRESKTFFAYSHHRAPLTTLRSVSRYCTSHLALPLRLSGSTRFLFCCYGNRPTVGIPIGDDCFLFSFFFSNTSGMSRHKLGIFIDRKCMRDGKTHMGVRMIAWISMRPSGWEEWLCPAPKSIKSGGVLSIFA